MKPSDSQTHWNAVPTKVVSLEVKVVDDAEPFAGVIVCEHGNLDVDQDWVKYNLPSMIIILVIAVEPIADLLLTS